jgi:phage gpG-like protein
MAQVSIKVKGADEIERKFNKLARKVKNRVPLYKRIGVNLLNEISHTFRTETHEGKRWKPLKMSTMLARRRGPRAGKAITIARRKERTVAQPKILQDTGTLRRSFVMDVSRRYVKVHVDPKKRTFKEGKFVGSPMEYAPFHEFGEGVPKRPMLPSKKRALEIAVKIADDYIKEGIKRVRL